MIITNFPVSRSRAFDEDNDIEATSLLTYLQHHTTAVGNTRTSDRLDSSTRVYDVTVNNITYWIYKPQYDFITDVASGKDVTHARATRSDEDPYEFQVFYIDYRK